MPALTPLVTTWLGPRRHRIDREFAYQANREVFRVPNGFVTDYASVPRIFWVLFPPDGRYTPAAVVHDWLYVCQSVSRKDADGIMLRIMREDGVSWWRRKTIYAAVRAGGWLVWKKRAPRGTL